MAERASIDEVIQRFPIGDHISAPINNYVGPNQRTGLMADLGAGVLGFVDGEHLPPRSDWPPVGEVVRFEVLRHDLYETIYDDPHRCQPRLWPLDQRWRNPRSPTGASMTNSGQASRPGTGPAQR
ncbi:MAG TPA: hypothetical protein VHC18_15145 [Amycolatopsis sp.]|nr:hypothetical protein [Amycolatopsis sp.]